MRQFSFGAWMPLSGRMTPGRHHDRHREYVLESGHRAGAGDERDPRRLAHRVPRRCDDGLAERHVERRPRRPRRREDGQLDLAEAVIVEMAAEERRDLVGVLVRHEPEVELRVGRGRQDGLAARPAVAGPEAGDVRGRLEEEAPDELGAVVPPRRTSRRRRAHPGEGLRAPPPRGRPAPAARPRRGSRRRARAPSRRSARRGRVRARRVPSGTRSETTSARRRRAPARRAGRRASHGTRTRSPACRRCA